MTHLPNDIELSLGFRMPQLTKDEILHLISDKLPVRPIRMFKSSVCRENIELGFTKGCSLKPPKG